MAKIYPRTTLISSIPSTSRDDLISKKQLVFTIWMRSLILGCNGCTVFDSNGEIVYRVDNYNDRQNNEVYLMDSRGKVLFTILKKDIDRARTQNLSRKGLDLESLSFKLSDPLVFGDGSFFVRLNSALIMRNISHVVMRFKGARRARLININLCNIILRRSAALKQNLTMFKIINNCGNVIVEAKRKRSTGGIDLGGDVLTMEVDPSFDRCLVMGLIVGYSLLDSIM